MITSCKYLYLIKHACGHTSSFQKSEPLTREDYYNAMTMACPACRAKAEAEAKAAAPAEVPEPILGRSAVYMRKRKSCTRCGKPATLREHDGQQLCQRCYREAGAMDGKNGVCDGCKKMRQRWYVDGSMLCKECMAKAPREAKDEANS